MHQPINDHNADSTTNISRHDDLVYDDDDDDDDDASSLNSSSVRSTASGYSSADEVIVSSENNNRDAQPAIHFAFPQRPPIRSTFSHDRWYWDQEEEEGEEEEVSLWENITTVFTSLYTRFTTWFQSTKSQLQRERQFTLRSRRVAEVPFCIATFASIYGNFILVRAAAVNGWVVDHARWDGTGHNFDKDPVITINMLETMAVCTSIVCGLTIWTLLIARTRMCVYFASKWCLWLAYLQGLLAFLAVYSFTRRSYAPVNDSTYYVYSRGYWSCLCAGILNLLAALGFTVDWLLSFPYSKLSIVLKGLVLPSIMVCSLIMIGALVYMALEDWTYSESLIFCWTAVTTIGYGDITPSRPEGRIFFLFYTVLGISIVGYMLLSIRAVITGTSSDIMKVNLMRVESLHDYSRHQRQKWLSRHPDHPVPISRRYSTAPLGGEDGGADTPTTAINDNEHDDIRLSHDINTSDKGNQAAQPLLRRRTTTGSARPRSLSNMSTFSNYTIAGILNNKDRQILVQVITKSGVVRMGVILIICWFGGAGMFSLLEHNWTYLDGLYFAFATQLTIGFGDIVPQTALAQEFWLVYIIISIAVAAYFISLCGDALIEKLQIVDDNEDPESLFYTDEVTGSPEDLDGMPSYTSFGRALAAEDGEIARTSPTANQQQQQRPSLSSDKNFTYGRDGSKYTQRNHSSITPTHDKTAAPVSSAPLQQMQLVRHYSLPVVSTATRDTTNPIQTPRQSASKKPYPLKILQQPRYGYMYSAEPPLVHKQQLSSSLPTGRVSNDSASSGQRRSNGSNYDVIARQGVHSEGGAGRYGSLSVSYSENSPSSDRGHAYYVKDDVNRPRHPCSPLASPPPSDERQHTQTMLSGQIGGTAKKRESHKATTATISPPTRVAIEHVEPRQSSVSGVASSQSPALLPSTSNSQHETKQQQHPKKKISKYLPIAVTSGSSSRRSKKKRQA